MGRPSSIDETTGARLLDAYQRTGNKAQAAAETGVSESAARRYLASFPEAAAPVVASQRQMVETAGASLFDSASALNENYQRLITLITQLEQGISELHGENTTPTPVSVNVATLREIREHIMAGTRLMELMISVHEVRRFQQAILDAIAVEVDEATRQRIVQRLRQLRATGLVSL
jgi:molybdenum-dependent DNA-binding transcriptional regulator ModE